LDALEKGLALPGDLTYLLSYNQGNVLFQEGDFSAAEEAYSRSLGLAPDFNSNILNRANARLQQAKYQGELKGLQTLSGIRARESTEAADRRDYCPAGG
jgi:Tfp pilus assembly protein PilF